MLAATVGLWGRLQDVNETVVAGRFSALQALAVILAAMLAAFSLIKTSSDYVQGESRFGWQLMRPIVILLCVMCFSPLCTAFEGTSSRGRWRKSLTRASRT